MEPTRCKKFVCKFCSKRFRCGKSLGGHIRTHIRKDSAPWDEDEGGGKQGDGRLTKADSGSLQSGYELRENPQRTKKFADQKQIAFEQLIFCKECGKGFCSLKALCGHMASHPDKSIQDNQSDDTETSLAESRKRWKKMKRCVPAGNNCSTFASSANCNSSSLSEIEQEQEEVAMCLLMLSKDSSFKRSSPNSWDDSVDNSLVLEAKSPCIDLRITIKNGIKRASKTGENNYVFSSSDNSDSGYFRSGLNEGLESDEAVLDDCTFTEPKSEIGSPRKGLKAKPSSKFKSLTEFKKITVDSGEVRRGAPEEYGWRKMKRKLEHCAFKTQRETNKGRESAIEDCGNSVDAETSYADLNPTMAIMENGDSKTSSSRNTGLGKKKKKEMHQCPICRKEFKSGQALGGHKRSHFIGNVNNGTVVIEQHLTQTNAFIDLNFPPPLD